MLAAEWGMPRTYMPRKYIHSPGHSLKIPLDEASYKLYYVNYKIRLNLPPVRILFKTPHP
jgi:hypothetical protein